MAYRISGVKPCLVSFLTFTNTRLFCRYCSQSQQSQNQLRKNPVGIQMLSESIHKQLFINTCDNTKELQVLPDKVIEHLTHHNLYDKPTSVQPDVDFKLPPMEGKLTSYLHMIWTQWMKGESCRLIDIQILTSHSKTPTLSPHSEICRLWKMTVCFITAHIKHMKVYGIFT